MATDQSITTKLNNYLSTSQHRSYFVIFCTLLFVLIMVVLGILPAYSAISLQGFENEKRASAIQGLEAKLSNLRNLTEDLQQNKELFDYFNFVFPNNLNQDQIINETIQLAKGSNLIISDMSFKDDSELKKRFSSQGVELPDNLKGISISLNLESSQQNFTTFLKLLEEKRRIFTVNNLNILRKPDSQIQNLTPDRYYSISMNFTSYYYVN